ncbi:MAG: tail fiber domain-containing protein [Bacteroidales bacterium]|nr:tail fiber domain-containing protein [Bacteroidales bacterium]
MTVQSNNTGLGTSAGGAILKFKFNFYWCKQWNKFNGTANSTALGYSAVVTASSQIRIGNVAVTSIGGYVGWTNVSDGRFKKNVNENVAGLSFISKLKPVTYTLDLEGINAFLKPEMTSNLQEAGDDSGIKEKEQIYYSGFIAQDVEKLRRKPGIISVGWMLRRTKRICMD